MSTWTSDLLGINNVYSNGALAPPERDAINFIGGSGITITASDNPVTLRTDVTFSTSVGVGAGSATTNVLQWSGTAWVATSTPTVTSLTANSFLAVGSPVPAAGGLRLANNLGVVSRTTGGVQLDLIYASGGDAIIVGDADAVSVTLDNANVIVNRFIRFPLTASTPKISQDALTSDAAPQNVTLEPQAAFSTATGTNRTPGSFVVNLGAPTNGGTDEAGLVIQRAAAFSARIGPLITAPAYGAVWLGSGLVPSATNYAIASNGTATNFNAATTLTLAIAGGGTVTLTTAQLTLNPSTIEWSEPASPVIRQATFTSDAAPRNFIIQPQAPFASATGSNRKGGDLLVNLATPTNGGTTESKLIVNRGGSHQVSMGNYGSGSSLCAVWAGTGLAPSGSNFCFLGDGATQTYLNVGNSGGSVYLVTAGTSLNGFEVQQTKLTWHDGSARSIQARQRTSDAATFDLTIKGQDAFATATGTNRNGGALVLGGGNKATGGVDGIVQLYNGATHVADFAIVAGNNTLRFDKAAHAIVWTDTPTSDTAPKEMQVYAGDCFASASTNINGARLLLSSGNRAGSGLRGAVQLVLGAVDMMVEVTEVASGRRVVVLNRMSAITTTQLPANTGDGVVYLGNVVTAPTAAPVSGGVGWADTGALKWIEPNSAVSEIAYRDAATGAIEKSCRRRVARVQTTNATVTTIFSFTVPDNTVVQFCARVTARNQTTAEQGAYVVQHSARRRSAGAAALIGTIDKVAQEEQAAWDVTTTTATNDFVIQVTGAAAQTIDWCVWVDIYVYTP